MKSVYRWPTVFAVFLLTVFSLGNQIIYRYSVPPGGDAIGHESTVESIMSGNWNLVFHYHSAWHLLVIAVAVITHMRTINVMAWLGPLLLVTSGMSLFFVNRRFFGPIAGLSALIIIGFFSNQPLQTLYDGSFPNVLAAGTVLPLVFMVAVTIFDNKKYWQTLSLFLISLVVLTYSHHITTLYALPILAIFFLCQFWLYLVKKGINHFLILILAFVFCAGALILGHYFIYYSNTSAAILAQQYIGIDGVPPFFHLVGKLDNPNAMLPLSDYPNLIGQLLIYLGLPGLVIAIWQSWRHARENIGRMCLILVIWFVILLVGSQTPALGFPVRLARDLSLPLALLSGLFITTVIDFILAKKKRFSILCVYIFVIACFILGFSTSVSRYRRMIAPNPLVSHLTVDNQAANYITKNLSLNDVIYAFNDDSYLPQFAPLHHVQWISDPAQLRLLIDPSKPTPVLGAADYVYIEYRTNREDTWVNNPGLIDAYKTSPYINPQYISFEQPEKKVYLFKVNHAAFPKVPHIK